MSVAMYIAVVVIVAGIILAAGGNALMGTGSERGLVVSALSSAISEYRNHPIRYPLVAMLTGGLFLTVYFGAVPVPGAVIYPGYLLAILASVCLVAGLRGGYLLMLAAAFILLAFLHTITGNSFLTETSAVFALLTLAAALGCRFVFFLRSPQDAR